MRQRIAGLVFLVALGGCKKDKTIRPAEPNPERANSTALWALAPAGTSNGIVIAPGAVGEMRQALIEVFRRSRAVPSAAAVLDKLVAGARGAGVDVTAPDGLGRLGIDARRGAALFLVGNDPYLIVPVSDRSAFRKAFGGVTANGVDTFAGHALVCAPAGRWGKSAPPAWPSSPPTIRARRSRQT